MSETERQKQAAALAAAELVCDGDRVGLGTGSTVAYLFEALLTRSGLRCAATSPASEEAGRAAGLLIEDLDEVAPLDIAIDGADQIDPEGWIVKGGGGAHTREKLVALASRRFVVIASAEKVVAALEPPIPLEIMRFGARTTLARIGSAELRDLPPTPDGNLLAHYTGPVEDPGLLAARLSSIPGVVEHGLFEPALVSEILIATEQGLERRPGGKDTSRP